MDGSKTKDIVKYSSKNVQKSIFKNLYPTIIYCWENTKNSRNQEWVGLELLLLVPTKEAKIIFDHLL